MSSTSENDQRRLTNRQTADLTDESPPSPVITVTSPTVHSRHIFRRNPSTASRRSQKYGHLPPIDDDEEGDLSQSVNHHIRNKHGLGIATGNEDTKSGGQRQESGVTPPFQTPGSGDPLLTGSSFGPEPTPKSEEFHDIDASDDEDTAYKSKPSSLYDSYSIISDTRRLYPRASSSTLGLAYGGYGGRPLNLGCKSNRPIEQRGLSWLSVTIMILSIYSMIFSGIFLLLAFIRPHYGQRIKESGGLSPDTAQTLSALFAKTIELSFVTVFVAVLGQVLSREAFVTGGKGVTIAQMMMRGWIMQPGTLITHWSTLRYAALSFIGITTLLATLMAMFYTTAAETLVSPSLRFGNLKSRVMHGLVMTSFANPQYLSDTCPTPIQKSADPLYGGTTCLQIEHAGQAYHNYQAFLSVWTDQINSGNDTSIDLTKRPNAVGLMYDNTTVKGSWIDVVNITEVSQKHGRLINNVTLAMPHSNVYTAAQNERNGIMQPDDLGGAGEYHLIASVPSPSVNVLCAGMTADELAPLIYTAWNGTNHTFNDTTWVSSPPSNLPSLGHWFNSTVVDDLFGFGNISKGGQNPPIFPKVPLPFNTLVNGTGLNRGNYISNAIYILAASPAKEGSVTPDMDPPYVLCSLKATLSPNCSTRFNASYSGGTIAAHCNDPNDKDAYSRSVPDAPQGVPEPDWKNVASEWANSLSLGAGISDGAAANARLLTQLIPTKYQLSSSLPSIAEALAVLAGCTLLLSSQDATFSHSWADQNYPTNPLASPTYEAFNASFQQIDYASGSQKQWQNVFFLVLFPVFLFNVFCFGYLIKNRSYVTDYTEPQNLFSISVNSPPSNLMAGACGAGPENHQFEVAWFVKMEEDHLYIESGEEPVGWAKRFRKGKIKGGLNSRTSTMEIEGSPVADAYQKLSSKGSSALL
ncbi:MAG: hypothetical protein M1834_006127 [Cirrosporium novae-zelandiae]|nr:MAG: hypothetical protein M1834_006127 [Cirrosporium novae-zelandiae]